MQRRQPKRDVFLVRGKKRKAPLIQTKLKREREIKSREKQGARQPKYARESGHSNSSCNYRKV